MKFIKWFITSILTLLFPLDRNVYLSESYTITPDETSLWMNNAEKLTLPPKENGTYKLSCIHSNEKNMDTSSII